MVVVVVEVVLVHAVLVVVVAVVVVVVLQVSVYSLGLSDCAGLTRAPRAKVRAAALRLPVKLPLEVKVPQCLGSTEG